MLHSHLHNSAAHPAHGIFTTDDTTPTPPPTGPGPAPIAPLPPAPTDMTVIRLPNHADNSFGTDLAHDVKIIGGVESDSVDYYGPAYAEIDTRSGNDYASFTGSGMGVANLASGDDNGYASGNGHWQLNGGGGNDSFEWGGNYSGGTGTVEFNGGSGTNSYTLFGTEGNATIVITHLHAGEHIDVYADDTVLVQDSNHSFMAINEDGTVTHVTMGGHHAHMFTDGTVVVHYGYDGKG